MRTQLEIQTDEEEQAKEGRETLRALYLKIGYQPQPRLSPLKRLIRLFKKRVGSHIGMAFCCCFICSLIKWAKHIVDAVS